MLTIYSELKFLIKRNLKNNIYINIYYIDFDYGIKLLFKLYIIKKKFFFII